jgi:hypothetical protein
MCLRQGNKEDFGTCWRGGGGFKPTEKHQIGRQVCGLKDNIKMKLKEVRYDEGTGGIAGYRVH